MRLVGPAGWAAARLWRKLAHRPVDTMAVLAAAAASLVIVVNAAFLQSGSHPAPFFANPVSLPPRSAEPHPVAAQIAPRPAEMAPARPATAQRPAQAGAVPHNDPIGDLIGSSVGSPPRVMAVQRILSEFGYGQIKPSGILNEATSVAIEKFESEHKLPVTGRLSDRLLSELAVMTGRPVE
jgi:hypothetical protein